MKNNPLEITEEFYKGMLSIITKGYNNEIISFDQFKDLLELIKTDFIVK